MFIYQLFFLQLHVYKEMRQSLQKYGKLEETAAIEKKIESLENVYDDTEEDSQGVKEENEEEDIEELLHASGISLFSILFYGLFLFISSY